MQQSLESAEAEVGPDVFKFENKAARKAFVNNIVRQTEWIMDQQAKGPCVKIYQTYMTPDDIVRWLLITDVRDSTRVVPFNVDFSINELTELKLNPLVHPLIFMRALRYIEPIEVIATTYRELQDVLSKILAMEHHKLAEQKDEPMPKVSVTRKFKGKGSKRKNEREALLQCKKTKHLGMDDIKYFHSLGQAPELQWIELPFTGYETHQIAFVRAITVSEKKTKGSKVERTLSLKPAYDSEKSYQNVLQSVDKLLEFLCPLDPFSDDFEQIIADRTNSRFREDALMFMTAHSAKKLKACVAENSKSKSITSISNDQVAAIETKCDFSLWSFGQGNRVAELTEAIEQNPRLVSFLEAGFRSGIIMHPQDALMQDSMEDAVVEFHFNEPDILQNSSRSITSVCVRSQSKFIHALLTWEAQWSATYPAEFVAYHHQKFFRFFREREYFWRNIFDPLELINMINASFCVYQKHTTHPVENFQWNRYVDAMDFTIHHVIAIRLDPKSDKRSDPLLNRHYGIDDWSSLGAEDLPAVMYNPSEPAGASSTVTREVAKRSFAARRKILHDGVRLLPSSAAPKDGFGCKVFATIKFDAFATINYEFPTSREFHKEVSTDVLRETFVQDHTLYTPTGPFLLNQESILSVSDITFFGEARPLHAANVNDFKFAPDFVPDTRTISLVHVRTLSYWEKSDRDSKSRMESDKSQWFFVILHVVDCLLKHFPISSDIDLYVVVPHMAYHFIMLYTRNNYWACDACDDETMAQRDYLKDLGEAIEYLMTGQIEDGFNLSNLLIRWSCLNDQLRQDQRFVQKDVFSAFKSQRTYLPHIAARSFEGFLFRARDVGLLSHEVPSLASYDRAYSKCIWLIDLLVQIAVWFSNGDTKFSREQLEPILLEDGQIDSHGLSLQSVILNHLQSQLQSYGDIFDLPFMCSLHCHDLKLQMKQNPMVHDHSFDKHRKDPTKYFTEFSKKITQFFELDYLGIRFLSAQQNRLGKKKFSAIFPSNSLWTTTAKTYHGYQMGKMPTRGPSRLGGSFSPKIFLSVVLPQSGNETTLAGLQLNPIWSPLYQRSASFLQSYHHAINLNFDELRFAIGPTEFPTSYIDDVVTFRPTVASPTMVHALLNYLTFPNTPDVEKGTAALHDALCLDEHDVQEEQRSDHPETPFGNQEEQPNFRFVDFCHTDALKTNKRCIPDMSAGDRWGTTAFKDWLDPVFAFISTRSSASVAQLLCNKITATRILQKLLTYMSFGSTAIYELAMAPRDGVAGSPSLVQFLIDEKSIIVNRLLMGLTPSQRHLCMLQLGTTSDGTVGKPLIHSLLTLAFHDLTIKLPKRPNLFEIGFATLKAVVDKMSYDHKKELWEVAHDAHPQVNADSTFVSWHDQILSELTTPEDKELFKWRYEKAMVLFMMPPSPQPISPPPSPPVESDLTQAASPGNKTSPQPASVPPLSPSGSASIWANSKFEQVKSASDEFRQSKVQDEEPASNQSSSKSDASSSSPEKRATSIIQDVERIIQKMRDRGMDEEKIKEHVEEIIFFAPKPPKSQKFFQISNFLSKID